MSKTKELRRLITASLNTVSGSTYYRQAPPDAAFPYKTYELSRVDLGDAARDDFDLCVDLWDRGTDPKTVEELADQLEALLGGANLPQETILPTFFRASRYPVADADKQIQHLQLHFEVQLYENQ